MAGKRYPAVTEFLDESVVYGLREFCDICGVHAECVLEMVESGVVEPEGPDPAHWRFTTHTVHRFQRARRLQRDLDINLSGLALALDLLDDVEALRNEVRSLHHQLAKIRQE